MDEHKIKEANRLLQKLCKWQSVFAAWQLGTRLKDDPECQAVRDHREVTMLMRAELSALVALLVEKGIFTSEEFTIQLGIEAEFLDKAYEKQFPGMKSSEIGMEYDLAKVRETMKGWRP